MIYALSSFFLLLSLVYSVQCVYYAGYQKYFPELYFKNRSRSLVLGSISLAAFSMVMLQPLVAAVTFAAGFWFFAERLIDLGIVTPSRDSKS